MSQLYCPYCMTPIQPDTPCPTCGLTQGSYHAQAHHLPPGTMLAGRYLLGRVLGEGGFGITYIGCDTRLDLKVAVKEYFPNTQVTRDCGVSHTVQRYNSSAGRSFDHGRERFIREAKALARMDKTPEIVAVRDFFQENETAYIVMEYVDGTTFKELVAQNGGAIPADRLLTLIKPLFAALEALHKQNLIHRDISPDNLMLESGKVRLLDFGCARESLSGAETMTIVLKQGFSPIEQYQHKGQGPWTDVYSLAATIYYCITGRIPPQPLDRLIDEELIPPRKLGANLTQQQELALLYGMGLQPTRRFQSVHDFYQSLYEGVPIPLVPTKRQRRPVLEEILDGTDTNPAAVEEPSKQDQEPAEPQTPPVETPSETGQPAVGTGTFPETELPKQEIPAVPSEPVSPPEVHAEEPRIPEPPVEEPPHTGQLPGTVGEIVETWLQTGKTGIPLAQEEPPIPEPPKAEDTDSPVEEEPLPLTGETAQPEEEETAPPEPDVVPPEVLVQPLPVSEKPPKKAKKRSPKKVFVGIGAAAVLAVGIGVAATSGLLGNPSWNNSPGTTESAAPEKVKRTVSSVEEFLSALEDDTVTSIIVASGTAIDLPDSLDIDVPVILEDGCRFTTSHPVSFLASIQLNSGSEMSCSGDVSLTAELFVSSHARLNLNEHPTQVKDGGELYVEELGNLFCSDATLFMNGGTLSVDGYFSSNSTVRTVNGGSITTGPRATMELNILWLQNPIDLSGSGNVTAKEHRTGS